MRLELKCAVGFIVNLLRRHDPGLDDVTLDVFGATLRDLLNQHYKHHWFPDKPNKGSGYRCIRINHKLDPLVCKAGAESGLTGGYLYDSLPHELTLWVDPGEVSYRIGEDGSVCVLYEHRGHHDRFHQKSCKQGFKTRDRAKVEHMRQIAAFAS